MSPNEPTSRRRRDDQPDAARFAERLGAAVGLRPWATEGDEVFSLSDGEIGFEGRPVDGGFELWRRDRGRHAPVAFASRLDDLLRLLAVVLGWTAATGLMRWSPPARFSLTDSADEVEARWEDEQGDERVARIRGLALRREKALQLGTWALADLDEIVGLVEAGARRRRG